MYIFNSVFMKDYALIINKVREKNSHQVMLTCHFVMDPTEGMLTCHKVINTALRILIWQ